MCKHTKSESKLANLVRQENNFELNSERVLHFFAFHQEFVGVGKPFPVAVPDKHSPREGHSKRANQSL